MYKILVRKHGKKTFKCVLYCKTKPGVRSGLLRSKKSAEFHAGVYRQMGYEAKVVKA